MCPPFIWNIVPGGKFEPNAGKSLGGQREIKGAPREVIFIFWGCWWLWLFIFPVRRSPGLPPNAKPSLSCSVSFPICLDFSPLLLDEAPQLKDRLSLKPAGYKILFFLLNFSPFCQRETNGQMSADWKIGMESVPVGQSPGCSPF